MAESIVSRECHGTAAELHAIPMPTETAEAELWIMRPSGPALVMGSSQKPEQFDQQRLLSDGVELATRRSGGGAVFIEPSAMVWIDVVAPRSSPLWSSELAENFLIVGRIWQQALSGLGVETELCVESPERAPASTAACWAGLGWGELALTSSAATPVKVVGLSQRRTRWGARVQAMAVSGSSSARVADYLGPDQATLVREAIPTSDLGLTTRQLETAVLTAFTALG